MSEDRIAMIESLRQRAVPRLRELGFKGSFPHFHRPLSERTDLLTFQFDKYGGGFVVEIAKAPPGGFTTSWGEVVPTNKLSVSFLPPEERLRLGSRRSGGDHWFRYDRGGFLGRRPTFDELAEQVRELLHNHRERDARRVLIRLQVGASRAMGCSRHMPPPQKAPPIYHPIPG